MKNSNQSSTEKYRILTKALLFLFHFPAILPVTFKKATRSNYPKRSSKPSKAKLESELKKPSFLTLLFAFPTDGHQNCSAVSKFSKCARSASAAA